MVYIFSLSCLLGIRAKVLRIVYIFNLNSFTCRYWSKAIEYGILCLNIVIFYLWRSQGVHPACLRGVPRWSVEPSSKRSRCRPCPRQTGVQCTTSTPHSSPTNSQVNLNHPHSKVFFKKNPKKQTVWMIYLRLVSLLFHSDIYEYIVSVKSKPENRSLVEVKVHI